MVTPVALAKSKMLVPTVFVRLITSTFANDAARVVAVAVFSATLRVSVPSPPSTRSAFDSVCRVVPVGALKKPEASSVLSDASPVMVSALVVSGQVTSGDKYLILKDFL